MLHRFLHLLERNTDAFRSRLKAFIGRSKPLQVKPYAGFGNGRRAWISGRVLSRKELPKPGASDSEWRNFFRMVRRWLTDEVPHARVRGTFLGETREAVADDEGYFHLEFATSSIPDDGHLWQPVKLTLLDPERPEPVEDTGFVEIPRPAPEFGVISDIDDTVIHTGATSFLKMVRTTLTGNAHTRMVFKGVAGFYQALRRGATGSSANPFFYVTSSPWNLYDLLVEIFRLNRIPMGALFMKDWGIDEHKFIKTGHREHKVDAIERVIAAYPGLKFILIGDSGQEDPEIYIAVLRDYPDRILAIYIRDVTDGERQASIHQLAAEIAHTSAELVLAKDSLEAARHAVSRGFIREESLEQVRWSAIKDEERE